MSEALDRIRSIGAQKIYEETHIPVEHVQAIIHESFDGFSKVQFLGFVSILEREYHEDLSDLRIAGVKHFGSEKTFVEDESVFVVPKRKKSVTLLYVFLAILVFAVVAYLNIDSTEQSAKVSEVDNSLILDAQKTLEIVDANASEILVVDTNASMQDANTTEELNAIVEQIEPIVQEKAIKSLKLVTKTKLWLGYIDLKTNRHYNKIFTGEFELDAGNDWLLLFGHSYVDIVLNDELVNFDSQENVHFLYEDGEIKAISPREFKRLNKGRKW